MVAEIAARATGASLKHHISGYRIFKFLPTQVAGPMDIAAATSLLWMAASNKVGTACCPCSCLLNHDSSTSEPPSTCSTFLSAGSA